MHLSRKNAQCEPSRLVLTFKNCADAKTARRLCETETEER